MTDPSLSTQRFGAPQLTNASWSTLPAPLTERILRQAFQDSNRSLLQRLSMSLVCRDWHAVMSRQAVDVVMVLPTKASALAKMAADLSSWLRTTCAPLRSITFEMAGEVRNGKVVQQAMKMRAKLTVSTRMLAASKHTLEEAYNLSVAKAPRHNTTLARFTALRCLSMSGLEELKPAKVEELLMSLPTTLETLELSSLDAIKGHNFACLPRLRQLCIEAKGDSRTDNEEIPVAVAELPPGLEILEVSVSATCETLDVMWAPGPPAALLRLQAIGVEIKEEMMMADDSMDEDDTVVGKPTVEVLEVTTADLRLTMRSPAPAGTREEYKAATEARKQLCFGQYMADWLAQCGAAAVRLHVLNERVAKGRFYITSITPASYIDVWEMRSTAYKADSKQLLGAVQGPCQARGIRCTDVDGDGQHLFFERM